MPEQYEPEVDDYVIWHHPDGTIDKGWVYFKCEEYITIETGIKPKPKDEYAKDQRHQHIHTLLLCHNQFWCQLKYVRKRTSQCPHHYSECED